MENQLTKIPEWLNSNIKGIQTEEYRIYAKTIEYIENYFKEFKTKIIENTEKLLLMEWKTNNPSTKITYFIDKENGTFIIYGAKGEYIANWNKPITIEFLKNSLKERNSFFDKITSGNVYTNDIEEGIKNLEKRKQEIKAEYKRKRIPWTRTDEGNFETMKFLFNNWGPKISSNSEFMEKWTEYYDWDDNPEHLTQTININILYVSLGFYLACANAGI